MPGSRWQGEEWQKLYDEIVVKQGLIRQIDVAPTLCLLLGIEPPAQATGVILRPALGRSAAMPPWR